VTLSSHPDVAIRLPRRRRIAEYAYKACAADSSLKKDGGNPFGIAAVPLFSQILD
jgi:hypothetical protein